MRVNRKCVKICAKVYSESRKIVTPENRKYKYYNFCALLSGSPFHYASHMACIKNGSRENRAESFQIFHPKV